MNKKLVTLLSLVGVLVLVTFLSIKKVASALENNGSVATGEKVTEVTDRYIIIAVKQKGRAQNE